MLGKIRFHATLSPPLVPLATALCPSAALLWCERCSLAGALLLQLEAVTRIPISLPLTSALRVSVAPTHRLFVATLLARSFEVAASLTEVEVLFGEFLLKPTFRASSHFSHGLNHNMARYE